MNEIKNSVCFTEFELKWFFQKICKINERAKIEKVLMQIKTFS